MMILMSSAPILEAATAIEGIFEDVESVFKSDDANKGFEVE